MNRVRLRPAHTAGHLGALYAVPHDHSRWPDHVERVAATIAVGQKLAADRPLVAADLSCGDGAVLDAIPAEHRIYGDMAPGWPVTGPIEETIHQIPHVDLLVCCETLEHLDDPDMVLVAIREKTDRLLLSTPVEAWGDQNDEHYWAWSQEAVEAMMLAAGFTVDSYEALDFRTRGPQFYQFGIWVAR